MMHHSSTVTYRRSSPLFCTYFSMADEILWIIFIRNVTWGVNKSVSGCVLHPFDLGKNPEIVSVCHACSVIYETSAFSLTTPAGLFLMGIHGKLQQ
jgi:hypothetical protein